MTALPVTHDVDFPVGPAGLDHVHDLLDRLWADTPAVSDRDRMMFETAVIEIVGNLVQHSNSHDAIDCHLSLRVDDEQLCACFTDTAEPTTVDLASASLPDLMQESGRGLAMARAALDRLEYNRAGGLNHWVLIRNRSR